MASLRGRSSGQRFVVSVSKASWHVYNRHLSHRPSHSLPHLLFPFISASQRFYPGCSTIRTLFGSFWAYTVRQCSLRFIIKKASSQRPDANERRGSLINPKAEPSSWHWKRNVNFTLQWTGRCVSVASLQIQFHIINATPSAAINHTARMKFQTNVLWKHKEGDQVEEKQTDNWRGFASSTCNKNAWKNICYTLL